MPGTRNSRRAVTTSRALNAAIASRLSCVAIFWSVAVSFSRNAMPAATLRSSASVIQANTRACSGCAAVPAGAPREVLDAWRSFDVKAEIARILALPDVKERFAGQGQEPHYMSADQFAAQLTADRQKYGNIIKTANIKMD